MLNPQPLKPVQLPVNQRREVQAGVFYYLLLKRHPRKKRFPALANACCLYKNHCLKNRLLPSLIGQALCLLKTQFAKKPKNPV
ncbi:MAG: hypothetical protein EPO58_02250 [Chitinophagaceae bacterium]|nr:MAG: hypothetical protein EPO58_02250 [Chitinophagaceae bacterium]